MQKCNALLQSPENPWMDFPGRNIRGIGRAAAGGCRKAMEAKAETLESPWRRGMFSRISQGTKW